MIVNGLPVKYMQFDIVYVLLVTMTRLRRALNEKKRKEEDMQDFYSFLLKIA